MLTTLVCATLVVAAVDWWAATTGQKAVEYVFKPLTMAVLIAVALAISDPVSDTARWVVVVGLTMSLIGDVFLMLGEKYFLAGLAAFLLAHVAYVPALLLMGTGLAMTLVGVAVVILVLSVVGTRILSGVKRADPAMAVPVGVYLLVISLMVIAAFGTANPWAIAGAGLFYFSDGCIGWDRFVGSLPARSLLVMVSYHVGQIGLVLSLTL